MTTDADLLAIYDDQLRTDAETPSALAVARLGPLRLITFVGGRGFVTYRDLAGADAPQTRALVQEVVAHYAADPAIERIEWKTRGHDHAPGLHEALVDAGFEQQETETVMLGPVSALDVPAPLPDGVTLRRVTEEADVRTMAAMQDVAFGDPVDPQGGDPLLHRLGLDDGMQLWVAEHGDEMVAAARLEPVAGTQVAGIWGGATLPAWRRLGLYRALTAARARAAAELGHTLLHSDSLETSRPILQAAGLRPVTTTTPYRRPAGSPT